MGTGEKAGKKSHYLLNNILPGTTNQERNAVNGLRGTLSSPALF